ncbi:uncharacterized protein TNCV_5077611 [Trichonephila clavipes]|uniref:Uncharacterized protein n=1 Tax=Trichonephila clavipes TaxID=2585209 RepID=A0A8X6V6N3_TRICX|nr:uncharacterized protein TNCV_5077611 [Trichonephila clavipes]
MFFMEWEGKRSQIRQSDGESCMSEALKESKARKNNPHRLQIFCCQRERHSQKETFQPASPSPTQLLGLICEGRGRHQKGGACLKAINTDVKLQMLNRNDESSMSAFDTHTGGNLFFKYKIRSKK